MGGLSNKNERVPMETILTDRSISYETSIGEGNISNIKIKNQNELLNSLITFVVIGITPLNDELNNNMLIKYSEKFFPIGKKFSHISLFLGFQKVEQDYDGVCIEYGEYKKDDKLYKYHEEFCVGESGLKYTQMSLNEYTKMIKYYNKISENKNCCLFSCNINSEIRFDLLLQDVNIGEKILNSNNFNNLIIKDEILEEIENRYSVKNYNSISNNCQDFASSLLKEIKAYIICPSTRKKIDFKKLYSYLPGQIVDILEYNEKKFKVNHLSQIIDDDIDFFYKINKNIPLIE